MSSTDKHRIFSFRDAYRQLADTDIFELPVVCFHNATEEVMGATFVSINVNQKPVNRDLLTQMKAILGLLDTDIDKACIDLIHDLDEDQTSPLRSRILRYPKEKDKWIKTNQLLPVVKGLLLPGGVLHEKNHAERPSGYLLPIWRRSQKFSRKRGLIRRVQPTLLFKLVACRSSSAYCQMSCNGAISMKALTTMLAHLSGNSDR